MNYRIVSKNVVRFYGFITQCDTQELKEFKEYLRQKVTTLIQNKTVLLEMKNGIHQSKKSMESLHDRMSEAEEFQIWKTPPSIILKQSKSWKRN